GGYWRGNEFYYNRSVTNVNVTNITNVYNHTVVNEPGVSRVSFHGGAGGVAVRPTAAEMAVEHERHIGVTALQRQHEQMARSDKSLRAAVNGGRPAIAAAPGEGGPAMHAGGGRAPQAAPPPGAQHPGAQHPGAQHPGAQHPEAQHPAAEREQRERGH